MENRELSPVGIEQVDIRDSILRSRIEICRRSTIPSSLQKCRETGRIEAFKLNWKEGMPNKPHIFWNSDVAKVLEGVACMLALHPDAELEAEFSKITGLIVSSQQKDGYINSYFSRIEPDKRWSNLASLHELYCAGHLMEAAVAGRKLAGGEEFLKAMCRYADYIIKCFGPADDQMHGYPGHEEIELALVKLYQATGEKKYLAQAKYFIDERGKSPNYYVETEKSLQNLEMCVCRQADRPVREMNEAYGHAVRAVYLYSGMADVARLTGDAELLSVCEKLFKNLTEKRMYITGGIGSSFQGEVITKDYDLTNSSLMYAESCAAIGLVRFASRMLNATGNGVYADVMEKAIFNGVLSGISLDGDKFFYTNYLELDENTVFYNSGTNRRKTWFDCSCCPTNFCRFIPQSLQYLWSEGEGELRLNIPVASKIKSRYGVVEVEGEYPYQGHIRIKTELNGHLRFALRKPGWCSSCTLKLNGENCSAELINGYLIFDRDWKSGDCIEYEMQMPVLTMHSNLKVTGNAGRIALMRGPLVYACETADNPSGISNMVIPEEQNFVLKAADVRLPAGTIAIEGKAFYESAPDADALYFTGKPIRTEGTFTAIPYYLWQNREVGNMAVWIRSL